MGLLDSVKSKITGRRKQDLGEIRAGVLNEEYNPEPIGMRRNELPPPAPMPPTPTEGMNRDELTWDSPRDDARESISLEPQKPDNTNYEVIDKLRFIENQLSAIRSQTELINERLKTIETRIGRRY
ncbi:hypothetical protein ACFLQN_04500 [Candidatus Aenigmatarchaeota archaeon]